MRRRLLQGDAVLGIDEMLRIMMQGARLVVEHRERALAQAERGSDRSAHARLVALAGLELVHDELDEMGLVAVHRLDVVQFADLAVDAHLQEALLAERIEKLAVVALASAHQRREQQAFASLEFLQDQVHDLRVGIAHHLLARHGRIGRRGAGVQEAQEIGNLRDGADGGTGVAARGLLLDGDDGAQAVHALDLGLLQDPHEMLGIGRERVHVAALPLGIQRVEGQRGLSAAADARDHDELAARQIHVDVLQIMGTGASDFDLALFIHKK